MLRPIAALLPRLLTLALLAALAGCGGTGSETPWPVEPDDVDLGPEGEARRSEELGSPSRAAPPTSAEPAEEASGSPPGSAPAGAPSSQPSKPPGAAPRGSSTPPSAPPSSQF